jgi:ABC-2 type transport system permease protein
MRLPRSEVLRARSRRLVPMLIIGGLLGIVVGMGLTAIYGGDASDAEVAQAQAQYDKSVARCMKGRSLEQGGQLDPRYASLEEFCRDANAPGLDGPQLRDLDVIVQGISTFVVLLGTLLGASLGGADWSNNTMTNLLTWEPRRARVFLTRALVVAGFIGVITLFLQVVFSAAYWLVAATRGTTLFLPTHFWTDLGATLGRVSAMAIALGLVAYVIAMFGRSTVASLGALFGYLVLFEGVIAGFRPTIQGNLLVRAASVIVSQQPILDPTRELVYYGSGVSGAAAPPILMDVHRAWIVVAVYLIVLGGLSLFQFRRRDVT